jgi:hypothetical protein
MSRIDSFPFVGLFLLAVGLSGCGSITKAEYPGTWPVRAANSARSDCLDISGKFLVGKSEPPLPFFLFGIPDTSSHDWVSLAQVGERLLADKEDATVTIESPDSDHIEVAVALRGSLMAKQLLTRSYRSALNAEWFGQSDKSFRCDTDAVVIVGAYVCSWDQYLLTDEQKRDRYRRPGKNDVGTCRGRFRFAKTAEGSLVMLQRNYFCYACGGLDEVWRRWEPANDTVSEEP